MTIVRRSYREFDLPTQGTHRAKLNEVKELGNVITASGEEKERVRFVWEILDQTDSLDRPLLAFQTFNLSLHPKSFLTQAIVDIIGRDPGNSFDLDELLNTEVHLVIKHNRSDSDGRTYANVATILRFPTEAEEAEAQRVRAMTERVKASARAASPAPANTAAVAEVVDEDIPF